MVNLEVLKINHKIKVIGPIHLKQKLTNLLKILYGNYFDSFIERNIEFIEISNESYSLMENNYKIDMIKVEHSGIEAYGYLINNLLGFTGDSSFCNNIIKLFNNCQTLIADCSILVGDSNHMGFDNISFLLKSNENKNIVATHLRDDTRDSLLFYTNDKFKIVEDGYCIKI